MSYRIRGIENNSDQCELCGKTNLKKVVVLACLDADGNEAGEIRVGTDCAGSLLHGRKSRKNASIVNEQIKAVEYAKKMIDRGYAKDQVAKSVTGRFGYQVDRRHNQFIIGSFASL